MKYMERSPIETIKSFAHIAKRFKVWTFRELVAKPKFEEELFKTFFENKPGLVDFAIKGFLKEAIIPFDENSPPKNFTELVEAIDNYRMTRSDHNLRTWLQDYYPNQLLEKINFKPLLILRRLMCNKAYREILRAVNEKEAKEKLEISLILVEDLYKINSQGSLNPFTLQKYEYLKEAIIMRDSRATSFFIWIYNHMVNNCTEIKFYPTLSDTIFHYLQEKGQPLNEYIFEYGSNFPIPGEWFGLLAKDNWKNLWIIMWSFVVGKDIDALLSRLRFYDQRISNWLTPFWQKLFKLERQAMIMSLTKYPIFKRLEQEKIFSYEALEKSAIHEYEKLGTIDRIDLVKSILFSFLELFPSKQTIIFEKANMLAYDHLKSIIVYPYHRKIFEELLLTNSLSSWGYYHGFLERIWPNMKFIEKVRGFNPTTLTKDLVRGHLIFNGLTLNKVEEWCIGALPDSMLFIERYIQTVIGYPLTFEKVTNFIEKQLKVSGEWARYVYRIVNSTSISLSNEKASNIKTFQELLDIIEKLLWVEPNKQK